MGVQIDKAGRDQFAPGVDLFRTLGRHLADLDDAALADGYVGLEQLAAKAIGNGAAPDYEAWMFGHDVSSQFDLEADLPRIMGSRRLKSTAAFEPQGCISLTSTFSMLLRGF